MIPFFLLFCNRCSTIVKGQMPEDRGYIKQGGRWGSAGFPGWSGRTLGRLEGVFAWVFLIQAWTRPLREVWDPRRNSGQDAVVPERRVGVEDMVGLVS